MIGPAVDVIDVIHVIKASLTKLFWFSWTEKKEDNAGNTKPS